MKILKYLFLLLVLAFVGATVFVATQKGDFDVQRSRFIKSPPSVVFNYVSELRNWENFNALIRHDASQRFSYPGNSSGVGAALSWKSEDGNGSVTTVYAKENDSVYQKMQYDGSPSELFWKFEDSARGTRLIWRAKGRMSFWNKIRSVFHGGVAKRIGALDEQSLANLEKVLVYEINTYKIDADGIVVKAAEKYLAQTINSSIANKPRNSRILLAKMQRFFSKNQISAKGRPFILYHTYDEAAAVTKFSVGIPVDQEIRTTAESDIHYGSYPSLRSVKFTLHGDYSHRDEVWKQAQAYIAGKKLQRDPDRRVIEIYSAGINETKSPSKWVTHFYFPLRETAAATETPVTRPRPAAIGQPDQREEVEESSNP